MLLASLRIALNCVLLFANQRLRTVLLKREEHLGIALVVTSFSFKGISCLGFCCSLEFLTDFASVTACITFNLTLIINNYLY